MWRYSCCCHSLWLSPSAPSPSSSYSWGIQIAWYISLLCSFHHYQAVVQVKERKTSHLQRHKFLLSATCRIFGCAHGLKSLTKMSRFKPIFAIHICSILSAQFFYSINDVAMIFNKYCWPTSTHIYSMLNYKMWSFKKDFLFSNSGIYTGIFFLKPMKRKIL